MQFHREKKKQTKKPQELVWKFIEKHIKTHETKIPWPATKEDHDREATRRQLTVGCLSDMKNVNHKQPATNTGYAAIH